VSPPCSLVRLCGSFNMNRTKPVSEKRRLREVLQYAPAYRGLPTIPAIDASPDTSAVPDYYKPRASADSTLTALAQLAVLRLGAQRAHVSLLDDHHQHVLAEATATLSIRAGPTGTGSNSLWLGAATIPRGWAMCDQILDPHPTDPTGITVIVNDVAQTAQFAKRTYVRKVPHIAFFAAAALVSSHGAVIGCISVYDDTPRPGGLSEGAVEHLQDLAATISTYLNTYTVQDQYRRGEKLTRGLISFAEGASSLMPIESVDRLDSAPASPSETATTSDSDHPLNVEGPRNFLQPSRQPSPQPSQSDSQSQLSSHVLAQVQTSAGSDTIRPGSARHTSIKTLQDSILPTNSRSMFVRAANVMMASSDLDGVIILDASVAATGHRQHPAPRDRDYDRDRASSGAETGYSKSSSSEEPSGDSSSYSGRGQSNKSSSRRFCQVLGSSIQNPHELGILAETSLARLLREFPHGKVFSFNAQGVSMSSTDDSASSSVSVDNEKDDGDGGEQPSTPPKRKTAKSRSQRAHISWKAVQEMLPGARSVAFIPFWDYVCKLQIHDLSRLPSELTRLTWSRSAKLCSLGNFQIFNGSTSQTLPHNLFSLTYIFSSLGTFQMVCRVSVLDQQS
jgi:hypothetical protein